ncbi:hypothetical protein [Streptomyces sp. NPDC058964]|uniref:phosphorylase family protein n=1 Tax=Streptomyces sp. NPDC058964 TaxID=3346681 RepID=UPI00369B002E
MYGTEAEVRPIVVLTALSVEYRAVRDCLVSVRRGPSHRGTVFEFGWLNGTPYKVVLAETGPGNRRAAALAERAVEAFGPSALFFVGVAGGLKPDVELGDVVVATKVYAYHGGKETAEGFAARPDSWPADHELEQLARFVNRSGQWSRTLSPTDGRRRPAAHFKPIAAGEVVLDAGDSALRQLLDLHYQDAVAIEMEGAGVAEAAHLNTRVPTLVVRGISDRADGAKKQSDDADWQAVAARNAAAFAFSVIRELGEDEAPYEPAAAPALALAPAAEPARRGENAPLVPSPAPPPLRTPWAGGQEFGTAGHRYLLHMPTEERSTPDFSLIQHQALARRLEPATDSSASPFVWLRRTEARHPTSDAMEALDALRREHDLVDRLHGRSHGLPDRGTYERIGTRRAVLTLPWPVSRTGGPCGTLQSAWGTDRRRPLTSAQLADLLHRTAGLCDTLAALHRSGATHRCLTPAGVIALDDGRLVLRDLGLAGHDPRPGEGPTAYRAPEQWLGSHRPGLIGAPADVYQLAALTYHLATGHPPAPAGPLPLRSHLGNVPDSLERAVRTALAQAPGDRPSARTLGTALRSAREDLLGDA